MATMILINKPVAAQVAAIYRARQMSLAELAAKKELVTMSTAIDKEAAKGNFELAYRLSGSITRLSGDYLTAAMAIISADIEAAEYTCTPTLDKNGKVIGYALSWATQEEGGSEGGNEDGSEGGNNGGNNSGSDNTEPVTPDPEPVDPEPTTPDEPVDPEPVDDTPVAAEDQDLSHYTAVTPGGSENPADLNWYEVVNDVLVASTDTTVDLSKTYYELTWEPIDPEDLEPLPEP